MYLLNYFSCMLYYVHLYSTPRELFEAQYLSVTEMLPFVEGG